MAKKSTNKDLEDSIKSWGSPIEKILTSLGDMYDESNKINESFVQGRVRLDEMADAVAMSASGVIRLGGQISDIGKTIIGIADGSKRNVIATEEQVSKLYAATEILGGTAGGLVKSFAEVGYETSQIGPNLEKSIEYIQSLGLNAKSVMGDVSFHMSMMNRFNFADGIGGLTKMAAQASMLRFDMGKTAEFADKVMDPEGAINMAASFQRLGLSVGALGDPFTLMNDAINDPGALQDSLIKATKQFTEFDEKSKSFKINPQGILTLREMAKETGISYDQLSKSALAAADLDKRLSAINPSINFKNEEDKQLLANMATMKDGEYVVQLRDDETGKIETKKLGEITQDELTKLREQQESAPKTLEDIQRSQLDVQTNIDSNIKSIAAKGTFGVVGSTQIRSNTLGAERISRAVTGAVEGEVPESRQISDKVTNAISKMTDLFTQKEGGRIGDKDFNAKLDNIKKDIKSEASGLGGAGKQALIDILIESNKNIGQSSGIEQGFKKMSQEIISGLGSNEKISSQKETTKKATQSPIVSREGAISGVKNTYGSLTNTSSSQKTQTTYGKVEFGTLPITITGTQGMTEQQLSAIFNSQEFKQYVSKLTDKSSNQKGQGVASYGK
jgi:hypothetical protein